MQLFGIHNMMTDNSENLSRALLDYSVLGYESYTAGHTNVQPMTNVAGDKQQSTTRKHPSAR
jgi:hypothetical protein